MYFGFNILMINGLMSSSDFSREDRSTFELDNQRLRGNKGLFGTKQEFIRHY